MAAAAAAASPVHRLTRLSTEDSQTEERSATTIVTLYLLPTPYLPPTVLTAPLPPSKMAAEHKRLLPYPKWLLAVTTFSSTLPERKMAAGAARLRRTRACLLST